MEIAKALASQAKIIIMDEPTLGLDPEGMRELLELMTQMSKEDGRTLLISSHQLYQVQQISGDRIVIGIGGQVTAAMHAADLTRI